MLKRSTLVWFAILVLASVNGALREGALVPMMGAIPGRAASTLLLCAIILLVTYFTITWMGPRSSRDAWVIGGVWVALTLVFEFLAGHYLFDIPWSALRAEYDVSSGRIWLLAVVTTFVAPAVTVRARQIT